MKLLYKNEEVFDFKPCSFSDCPVYMEFETKGIDLAAVLCCIFCIHRKDVDIRDIFLKSIEAKNSGDVN